MLILNVIDTTVIASYTILLWKIYYYDYFKTQNCQNCVSHFLPEFAILPRVCILDRIMMYDEHYKVTELYFMLIYSTNTLYHKLTLLLVKYIWRLNMWIYAFKICFRIFQVVMDTN